MLNNFVFATHVLASCKLLKKERQIGNDQTCRTILEVHAKRLSKQKK